MRLLKAVLLTLILGFASCSEVQIARLPNNSAQFLLKGKLAETFRAITKHEAITPSEKVSIYGTENPPGANLQCHEGRHQLQAAAIADALVAIRAISDIPEARMYAWLAIYAQEYLQTGYENNRFEKEATEKCAGIGE